uniref:Uncharacterized protein n=1 Tax=Caenorhabditis japonica TaxID=281687 RepID=A0A8R1E6S4_CAEJA
MLRKLEGHPIIEGHPILEGHHLRGVENRRTCPSITGFTVFTILIISKVEQKDVTRLQRWVSRNLIIPTTWLTIVERSDSDPGVLFPLPKRSCSKVTVLVRLEPHDPQKTLRLVLGQLFPLSYAETTLN